MGETYMGHQNGARSSGPAEAEPTGVGACRARVGSSIQDMIRLTSRFAQEWFRSFDTLEADLQRFATLHHLGPEEVQQLRMAIETLHREEQVENGGRVQEA